MRRACSFFLLLLLTACSDAGRTPELHLADIAGLWNSSEQKDGTTDLMYTRISRNGDIVEYDYDGDAADRGLPCYVVETGVIKPMRNSRFLVTEDMQDDTWFEIRVELLDGGEKLKVAFIDPNDPAKDTRTQAWVREKDATLLDKEPSCKE